MASIEITLEPSHYDVGCKVRNESKSTDGGLLRLARRWLACHAAIGDLPMAEEPEAVGQVRAVPRKPVRDAEGVDWFTTS